MKGPLIIKSIECSLKYSFQREKVICLEENVTFAKCSVTIIVWLIILGCSFFFFINYKK
jgi:hypothetical protein